MTGILLLKARFGSTKKAMRVSLTAWLLGISYFVAGANAQIVLDYSQDNANQNFFNDNPLARAALEAAIADINAVVDFDLGAVSDVTRGTAGNTTIDFDFEYNYLNPATGNTAIINNTAQPANTYRVFAGARTLGGSTLGQGGPGGAGFSASALVGSGSIANAIANAEANDTHRRGGPTIVTLSGNIGGSNFTFDVGLGVGSLVFDDDANWHFDHTIPVAAGTSDFYSVALHEALHTLGIGESNAWSSLNSGGNWLGSEVVEFHGTGTGIVDPDGDHFAENILSPRITDGVMQEIVMDPNLTRGTRKGLTEFDLAALRDLGFETNITMAPFVLGDVDLNGVVNFLDISPFITVLSNSTFQNEADTDRNGTVNFLDISPFIAILSGS